MKVLVVHNSYLQAGGEDVVFAQEKRLLEANGHCVVEYHRSNEEMTESGRSRLGLIKAAFWATDSASDLRRIILKERPNVAHFHNIFAVISPSAYYECRKLNVPVVQTVHNYRLICPRGDLFRKNAICEQCLGKAFPWPGIVHGCYHNSSLQTGIVGAMVAGHRWLGTWESQIDLYIALTEHSRRKLIEGGLPANKIVVKPNFADPDPGFRLGAGDGYALFAGRLTPEKRILTLVRAWTNLRDTPLCIVGDGPNASQIKELIESSNSRRIKMLGFKPRSELVNLIKGASLLIFPSEWYETFGLAMIEAFACGVPVIAARLGAMKEIIDEGRTGLLFSPGDPDDLVGKVRWALDHPEMLQAFSARAREQFETRFSAAVNYPQLMSIYQSAIDGFQANA